jgi:hypothetical protein
VDRENSPGELGHGLDMPLVIVRPWDFGTRLVIVNPLSLLRRSPLVDRRGCLQPVDAGDSALPRSGTPHNPFLAASNRPGGAGARIAGDGHWTPNGIGTRRLAAANRRGRSRGGWTPLGTCDPIAYVASAQHPARRNRRWLRSTPHNWLGHITARGSVAAPGRRLNQSGSSPSIGR